MSRRHSHTDRPSPATSAPSAVAGSNVKYARGTENISDNVTAEAPTRHPIRYVLPAAIIAAIWIIALTILSVFTANPITLNQAQVLGAHYVLTAVVDDVSTGRLTIEKEWKLGEAPPHATVDNLAETGAQAGHRYLIPITLTAEGRYVVTPTPLAGRAPLIYPDEPEAEQRLQDMLALRESR